MSDVDIRPEQDLLYRIALVTGRWGKGPLTFMPG